MSTIKRELLTLVEKHNPMKYWNTSYKREFGIRKLGISKIKKDIVSRAGQIMVARVTIFSIHYRQCEFYPKLALQSLHRFLNLINAGIYRQETFSI